MGIILKAGFFRECDRLLDELLAKPGAAQLRGHLDVLDAHHADFGARELEEPKALTIDSQDEFVDAVEFLALDRDGTLTSGQVPIPT